MKKVFALVMIILAVASASAQQGKNLDKFVPSDVLSDYLTPHQIDSMLSADPEALLRMNRTIYAYSPVVVKLWEEDIIPMGYLDQYLPEGMQYSEDDIISYGCINPYIWKLPSDKTKYKLYKLHRPGYYVVVMPEDELEIRVKAYLQQFGF